jgi:hypothetical protein
MNEVLLVETTESAFSRRAHSKTPRRAGPFYSKPVAESRDQSPTEAGIFFRVRIPRSSKSRRLRVVPAAGAVDGCGVNLFGVNTRCILLCGTLSLLRLQAFRI